MSIDFRDKSEKLNYMFRGYFLLLFKTSIPFPSLPLKLLKHRLPLFIPISTSCFLRMLQKVADWHTPTDRKGQGKGILYADGARTMV